MYIEYEYDTDFHYCRSWCIGLTPQTYWNLGLDPCEEPVVRQWWQVKESTH